MINYSQYYTIDSIGNWPMATDVKDSSVLLDTYNIYH